MRFSRIAKPFDDPDYRLRIETRWLPGARLDRRLRVQAYLQQPESVPIVRVPEGIAREDFVQNAIIDGELVCLEAQGVSRFNELLSRRTNPSSMLVTCCGSTVKAATHRTQASAE